MTVQRDRRIETLTGQPQSGRTLSGHRPLFLPLRSIILCHLLMDSHGFIRGDLKLNLVWNHSNFCERMMRWDLRNRDTPVDLVIMLKVWITCCLPINTFSSILPGDSQVTCLRSSNPTANHWAKRFLMDELRAWSSCLASRSLSSFSPSLQEIYIKYLCLLLCTCKIPQSEYFNTLLCK